MRRDTKRRKQAIPALTETQEQAWWRDRVAEVMLSGKQALDAAMLEIGQMVAETIRYMERNQH